MISSISSSAQPRIFTSSLQDSCKVIRVALQILKKEYTFPPLDKSLGEWLQCLPTDPTVARYVKLIRLHAPPLFAYSVKMIFRIGQRSLPPEISDLDKEYGIWKELLALLKNRAEIYIREIESSLGSLPFEKERSLGKEFSYLGDIFSFKRQMQQFCETYRSRLLDLEKNRNVAPLFFAKWELYGRWAKVYLDGFRAHSKKIEQILKQIPSEDLLLEQLKIGVRAEKEMIEELCFLADSIERIQRNVSLLRKGVVAKEPSTEEWFEWEDEGEESARASSEESIELDEKRIFPVLVPQAIVPEISKEAKEIEDHLFLAAQGIELLLSLYNADRTDLLSVCLHSYLIDIHVVCEQLFQKKTLSHSLTQIIRLSGRELSSSQREWILTHDQALLWARYPAYYKRGSRPSIWLQELQERAWNRSKEKIPSLIAEIEASYTTFSEIAGGRSLSPWKMTLVELQQGISPYRKLAEQIRKTIKECPRAVATLPLEEISHYLIWMDQAEQLKILFPEPKWGYWITRIFFNMDKLFKHLFTADCLLHKLEPLYTHNLRIYVEALGEIHSLKPDEIKLLQDLNINIGYHYVHTTEFPLTKESRELLDASKGGKPFLKERDLEICFKMALDLFARLLPVTLESLTSLRVP